jgi:hypothetical protein
MDIRRFVGWLWLLSGLPIGLRWQFFLPRGGCCSLPQPCFLKRAIRCRRSSWRGRIEDFGLSCCHAVAAGKVSLAAFSGLRPGVRRRNNDKPWLDLVCAGPYHSKKITDLSNPFPILVWVYLIWNGHHFCMQNFGVLPLYGNKPRRAGQRQVHMCLCIAGTDLGMYAPPILAGSQSLALLCVGVFSFNHWLVAIALATRVSRHTWVFIVAMLMAGAVGFVWMIPTSSGPMIRVIPVIICARMGLGFVPFPV